MEFKIEMSIDTVSVIIMAIAEASVATTDSRLLAIQALLEKWARKMQAKMWTDERTHYKVKLDTPTALALYSQLQSTFYNDPYHQAMCLDVSDKLGKFKDEYLAQIMNRNSKRLGS
jgi:hypothetical protein